MQDNWANILSKSMRYADELQKLEQQITPELLQMRQNIKDPKLLGLMDENLKKVEQHRTELEQLKKNLKDEY